MKFSLFLFMVGIFLSSALTVSTACADIYLVYADQITFLPKESLNTQKDPEKKFLINDKDQDCELFFADKDMRLNDYMSLQDLSCTLAKICIGAHNLAHYNEVFEYVRTKDFWQKSCAKIECQDGIVKLSDFHQACLGLALSFEDYSRAPLFVFNIAQEGSSELKIKLIKHPHDLKDRPQFGCMDPSKYDGYIDCLCCTGTESCNSSCSHHAKEFHKHGSWLVDCCWNISQIFCCFNSAPICSVACTCGACLFCAACVTGNL